MAIVGCAPASSGHVDPSVWAKATSRLADYFLVVGPDHDMTLDDELAEPSAPKRIDSRYKPAIIDRYPLVATHVEPLPPHVWMFCFPCGISLLSRPKDPEFFTFVLTELDGERFYGHNMIFYEKLSRHQMGQLEMDAESQVVYAPKSITIFSHHHHVRVSRLALMEVYRCFTSSSHGGTSMRRLQGSPSASIMLKSARDLDLGSMVDASL
eukprot:TRINITY_DN20871_c0_g1_i1.p1 TRINITY_DN20871_c0_g1~~TRINITY_DN20871_c0_g1_i1.p1  ORF type:complete len:244 (-),score=55.42 TRINITY_DN20871_c0_g1_i1:70-699(-)